MARAALPVAIAALCVSLGVPAPAAEPGATLTQVLARVAAYLAQYEPQLSTVLAEEHYGQTSRDWADPGREPPARRRTLDSDFLFLRLPGGSAWLGLRDTFRVDGSAVRPAEAGVLRDLRTGSADTLSQALRLVAENSRRNLGAVYRTINGPTTVLDFLIGQNQPRFQLSKSGEQRSHGRTLWVIRFNEVTRPTMIKTREGADQRARGEVWIDPATGAIERTLLDLGDDGPAESFVRSRIIVTYTSDPALGMLVPTDMVENYYRPPSASFAQLHISAHATYSRFRRFEVSARILAP